MKPFVCSTHGSQEDPKLWISPKTGFAHRWCRTCLRDRFANRGKYMSEWRAKKKEHRAVYIKDWRERNAEGLKTERLQKHAALVARVVAAYGGKCVCCGETEPIFLTMDHINNDGKADRLANGRTTNQMYKYIERCGYPKDRYRVLCANCNFGRQRVGGKLICPHVMKD